MARLNVLTGRARQYGLPAVGRGGVDESFEANVLTHDRARFERSAGLVAAEPRLGLGAPTWGWLDFAFRAMAYLDRPERLHAITVPVVIVAADDDRLVDNNAAAAAARNLPQGQLITVPGAFHEILMETDPMRNIFLRAFDALTGRVAPKPAEAPKAVEATRTPRRPEPAPAPSPAPSGRRCARAEAAAKPAAAKKPTARKTGRQEARGQETCRRQGCARS